jgi:putative sterol carrier protein
MNSNYVWEDGTMALTIVQKVLDRVANLDPAKIQDTNGVFLFELTGEGGGKWTLTLADGKAKLKEGETTSPNVTLAMDAQDFVAMSKGELNAVSAFMQGKIKISGDMSLAMQLQSILA